LGGGVEPDLELVAPLAGVVELELQLVESELEFVGAGAMTSATGGEVADANLEGLAFSLALGGLDLPGIARAQELGDEDARWGLECKGSHETSCRRG
jgi:hypothetical protein